MHWPLSFKMCLLLLLSLIFLHVDEGDCSCSLNAAGCVSSIEISHIFSQSSLLMCCAKLLSLHDNHWRERLWLYQLLVPRRSRQSSANLWAIISLAAFYRNMKRPPAHYSEHQTSWFIPLMNYRHDAAPLGQFSRVFCMTRCSHPFIMRHQLMMKNQWNRS